MNEFAAVFGQWNHLVGVLGRPKDASNTRNVAVLMLTPGMLHHIGPMRLHVEMARRFSDIGIMSLRFCLSGIGESFAVAATGTSTERAVSEIREAMDWFKQQHGIEKFVLFGLCSGADDGVYAALADERVVGLVLMDGCGFRTRGYHLRKWLWHHPRKALGRLRYVIQRQSTTRRRSLSEATSLPFGDDIREFPEREQAESEFQMLVDRGRQLLFLYTGGASSYFNGASQFVEMFPNLRTTDRITLRYLPHMDHVARLAEDRRSIVDEVTAWVDHRFPEKLPQSTPIPLAFPTPVATMPVPTCGM
jgi:pimeloyl-ACP methyl ester carboxylesterase